jgi:flagellar biosynthetic protein FliP
VPARSRRAATAGALFALSGALLLVLGPRPAVALPTTEATPSALTQSDAPVAPQAPTPPTTSPAGITTGSTGAGGDGRPQSITIDLGGGSAQAPSQSVVIILGLTVLALAPSLLIMLTSFTRIVIVLSLTRNALGLQSVPPNQVLTGLALFLSLFVMAPTLSEMNRVGLQPYLHGDISQSQAFDNASKPLKEFMLANTRPAELNLMTNAAGEKPPEDPHDVNLPALIPAFILSELKTAFIIGFVVFVPFIVIDLVVSSVLMSLGMMMLPPVTVSLPFKVLLFVMVGGWSLVVQTLLSAYH